MNTNISLTIAIEINSDKQLVWDALVNPDKIRLYLYGTDAVSDWQKGSSLIFRGEYQGQNYIDKGTILEIDPGNVLKYNYLSSFSGLEDIPENYSIIEFRLIPFGNGTQLTLFQTGFINEVAREHSEIGWSQALQKIKEIIETGQ